MMIRESRTGPGHFREYTCDELASLGREIGWTLVDRITGSYFNYEALYGFRGMLYRRLNCLLPSGFHDGFTLCFRKTG
jgi:hypothetical protein